jgi:hypothetical protein
MAKKTLVGGMDWAGDWEWLPGVILALIALGVLPPRWKWVALAALMLRRFDR